jgi:hypothetical protein
MLASRIAIARGKKTEQSFGLTNSKPTFVIENKGGDRGLTRESAPNNAVALPAEVVMPSIDTGMKQRNLLIRARSDCRDTVGFVQIAAGAGLSEVVVIRATSSTPRIARARAAAASCSR